MNPEATLLSGKAIGMKHLELLSQEVKALFGQGVILGLATVQVGDSKDTLLYSKAIHNLFQKVGITHRAKEYPADIPEEKLLGEIAQLNKDKEITGILIFSPLPKSLNAARVLSAVNIYKDVEGRGMLNRPGVRLAPPTAMASVALAEATGIDFEGKEAVVVGRSDVVGKPAAILLIEKRATVTVCNSKTRDLKSFVGRADILIATAGQPELIQGDWIKPGAVVIDVGENIVNGQLVGDVEFLAAKKRASFISPVPGGVGPLTNVMLLQNLVTLSKIRQVSYENS